MLIWFPTSQTSHLSLICLPACRNMSNRNSCLILISSQLEVSEWVANLHCSSFFQLEVQFTSNPFQDLLGRDILVSTEKLVLRYTKTTTFSFLYFQRFSTPVNRGQNGNTSRHTPQIAMDPPRQKLQNLLSDFPVFRDMVIGCPLACWMIDFEICLFQLDLSSTLQEYLQWELQSCFAFDEISSHLEVAAQAARLQILF